jgi:hypothetical protein
MDKKVLIEVGEELIKIFSSELLRELITELGKYPDGYLIEDLKYISKSFGYKIDKDSIIIYSTWKLMADYLDGKNVVSSPDLMDINGESVVLASMDQDGESEEGVSEDGPWLHPKIKDRNFIDKAMDKSKDIVLDIISGYEMGDIDVR